MAISLFNGVSLWDQYLQPGSEVRWDEKQSSANNDVLDITLVGGVQAKLFVRAGDGLIDRIERKIPVSEAGFVGETVMVTYTSVNVPIPERAWTVPVPKGTKVLPLPKPR
jgi:hypothetical protein